MGKIVRKIISTTAAPKPGAPYSQAVQVNDTLYISGCLGQDPATGNLVGGIKEQVDQALKNIGAILHAAGTDYDHDFKDPLPARAAYQVGALPKNGLVEIEVVAVVGEIVDS